MANDLGRAPFSPDPQLDLFATPDFLPNSECDEDELQKLLAVKSAELDTLVRVAKAYDMAEDRIDRADNYSGSGNHQELAGILSDAKLSTRTDLGSRITKLKAEVAEIRRFIEEAQVIDHHDPF